jgi:hypothetical protein
MGDAASNMPADGRLGWEVPGKLISVRLSVDVVGRLGMAVREGFKALPRRGLETGGLLLGTKREAGGKVVINVDDFEPIESEHAAGPSYLLSDADRRLLEARIAARAAAANKTSIVGFYRSHTRRGFAITVEDASLFSTYFPIASDVFLLIKSNEGAHPTAGFIIREEGKVLCDSPYVQFPLDPTIVMPAASETAVPALPMPQARPRVAQIVQPPARRRTTWTVRGPMWLATAGAMVLAVVLPFGIHWRLPGSIPAQPGLPLALSVTSTGNGLRLSWNRRASRQTGHAVLRIRDGQEERQFELDSRQLSEGSVAYWPRNSDVDFRLELLSPGATVAESVRAIGGPSVAPVAVPPSAAVIESPTVPAVKESAVGAFQASRASVSPKPPHRNQASRASVSPKAPHRNQTGTPSQRLSRAFALPPPESNPSGVAPDTLPDSPSIQPVVALPLEHSNELLKLIVPANSQGPRVATDSSFRVSVEPVTGSRLEHLARNIPLVGRRYRRSDYVPPASLRNSALPNSPYRNVAQDVDMDVKVYVDSSGKVNNSEVLSKVTEANRDLAALVMFSARRWEFIPARTSDGAVPGEVILHYHFGPGGGAAGNQTLAAR